MKRPGRLHDIASSVGVSASTVSRALRRPELVRAETRADIIKAAQLAGYELPDPLVSPARPARTIGLIVPDLENPFFTLLLKAAAVEARRHSCSLIVADTNEDPLEESEVIAMTRERADGLIIASSRLPDASITAMSNDARVVLINREIEGVPSVLVDNRSGMRQAVEHLVALGHRLIAYVEGPRHSWSNARRRETFLAAAGDAGVEALLIGPYEPRFESGLQAADIAVTKGVTAIIGYNDLVAFGILSRLNVRGIAVPEAMSIIGFDDVPAASIWSPSLTTVAASTASVGKTAVRDLLQLARGKPLAATAERQLTSRLVVRNSTGPVGAST